MTQDAWLALFVLGLIVTQLALLLGLSNTNRRLRWLQRSVNDLRRELRGRHD